MMDAKFEITRSFAIKKNLGNFENLDVFCSMKEIFDKKPTPKKIEEVSDELYKRCVGVVMGDVINSVIDYRNKFSKKVERKENAELEFMGTLDPDNSDLAG